MIKYVRKSLLLCFILNVEAEKLLYSTVMRKLLLIVCLLVSFAAHAADGNHQSYIPKSPEAAAFDRVPDIPVSSYTGSMTFSLPIYTLVSGDIQVPISLDYQGNAIPVNQEATWVGLNWLLNAGGAITSRLSPSSTSYGTSFQNDWKYMAEVVSLKSIPLDGEFPQMYYKMDGCHPNWRGGHGKNWFASTKSPEGNNGDISSQLYSYILDKQAGEAPTYHATFLGNSLTYVWDRQKDEFFLTGRKQNFKITGSPSSPTILDGRGFKYSFTARETGGPEGYLVNPETSTQSYTLYLTKIESPAGHTVTFHYVSNGTITSMYGVSENLYSKEYPIQAIGNSYRETTLLNSNKLDRSISQLYRIKTLRLESIESDDALVKFVPSSDNREDLDGSSKKLSRIEIYRKENGKNKLLKSFSFGYSYFSKNTAGGNTVKDLFSNLGHLDIYDQWFPSDDFMYKRLRLDSYSENDASGTPVAKYSFNYYGSLPCKCSAAIDYWGYYNGQENSNGRYHTLLPKHWSEQTADVENGFPVSMQYTGADRRFNESCAMDGMLSSITYPTGGTAKIYYEGHRFSNYKYFGMGTNSTANPNFKEVSVYATNQSYGKVIGAALYDSTFQVKSEGLFELSLSYTISNRSKQPCWRNVLSCPLLLYHYGTYYGKNGPVEAVSGCDVLNAVPSDTIGKTSLAITKKVRLTPGKYRLSIPGGSSIAIGKYPDEYYQVKGSISYLKSTYISVGGGLRVKSIQEDDGKGNTTSINYDYTNPDCSSSGLLQSPAIFARRKILVFQDGKYQEDGHNVINPPTAKEIRYALVSGDNAVPNPAFVSYGRVTVQRTGNGETNGKEVFTYRNRNWGTSLEYCRRIEDPRNGMLLSDSIFDENGKLQRSVTNTYSWKCVDSRLLNAVIENIYSGPNSVTGGNALSSSNAYAQALGGGCMQIYLYPSVQFSLLSSHSTTTDFGGGRSLTAESHVIYNQSNTLDSIATQSQSESSDVVTTETYYPQDALSKGNMRTLVGKFINEYPLEELQSVKNEDGTYVTSDMRHIFNDQGNIINEYSLNIKKQTSRSNFSLLKDNYTFGGFDMSTILSYNSSGKPRMVKENSGDVVTYIWGYCSNYPIAVIKGVDYSAVCSLLGGESVVKALETAVSPTLTPQVLHSKLTQLAGGVVTTYGFAPQVGMVEMITPNGEKTSYSYDAFCRLSSVLDHNGIVSSSFKYNYKH